MSDETPASFDPALVPFGELVAGFGPEEDEMVPEAEDASGPFGWALAEAGRMRVERVSVDLPVELAVMADDAGQVRLGGSPPTQHIATATMPVLHRLRVRIVRTEDHGD